MPCLEVADREGMGSTENAASTISADESMFYAIVPTADRRDNQRQARGASATVVRVIGGLEVNRFGVRVTDASPRGVGIRSRVPLQPGGVYRLEVGLEQSCHIKVIRCRPRIGLGYDIGALFVAEEQSQTVCDVAA